MTYSLFEQRHAWAVAFVDSLLVLGTLSDEERRVIEAFAQTLEEMGTEDFSWVMWPIISKLWADAVPAGLLTGTGMALPPVARA